MAKDPAFLFYPGDWLGGTMGMTLEHKGAYLELLIFQFNNGRFTTEQATALIGGKNWLKVRKKFSEENTVFYNKRLDEEITKRREHSTHQRENVMKRWNKDRIYDGTYDGITTVIPLENEDCISVLPVLKTESIIQEDTTGLSIFTLEAAERNQYTHTGERNTDFIKEQWEIFLLERKNDPSVKQRQNVGRLQEYFLNWLRTKFPKQKNGKKFDYEKLKKQLAEHGDKKISEL